METCPICNNAIFKTQRISLNWLHVVIGLAFALLIFLFVVKLFQLGSFSGHGGGKAIGYILLAAIGSIGWLFSKKVKKEFFEVQNCTRCDYKLITKVNE